jgi:malate dehydrogenase (quinone)
VTVADLKNNEAEHVIKAKFVFIGAGGAALKLLQESGIPEADDYAGFPVGGQFLVSDNPEVVNRHLAKVYGQASVGRRRCPFRTSIPVFLTVNAWCCSGRSRPSRPSS